MHPIITYEDIRFTEKILLKKESIKHKKLARILSSSIIILLFALLIRYAFRVMEHTTDLRARFLALGVATFFAFQVFVNIGMTIGIAPITGLTLPFLSY